MGPTALVVVIVVVALAFDFTNGFHDSANAIATSISTRALTPRIALVMAAVFNVVGALISTKVAKTVGSGIIPPPTHGTAGLEVVLAALLGAIVWNLITWYFGLPSSSTHALIGGLVGAALAAAETIHWSGVVDKVVIPMVVSPLIGFGLAYAFMVALLWAFRRVTAHRAQRGFRTAQIVSAAAMSFGHGTQDAQKTMGVIALTLVVSGHLSSSAGIPLWVILASAGSIAAGTYSGGWRIMRTLGRRIYKLTPASGFAAQTVATGVLLGNASLGLPVSTTHVITASVMGVGATRRVSAVRWGVAGNIVFAWVLTLPAAGAVAAGCWGVIHLIAS
ncbi:inorganic phosphate transporter [Jatrophihabitans endophyticus]|uniref:inorganic phosphate transporter n=1 Tax=Jatrophihabitans endophyticus TaxID=1206085 RepID=UPI001A02611A|nr:inorganic phosphate transporter [Jatrophihabitans endophyticus]MBE7189028.1 inorganic phosphate transporter [Jatrophihabitans endophyticus]